MRNHIKHIGLLITLLIFCGCTEKESSSSVVIEFQSKGVSSQSLAAEDIEIIIVNVSGPGIPTKVVAQRDCHESNEVCSSIVLNDIPTGSNRFIQLLVVTKESETDNGSIYYGDVESEIVGEVSVPILIEEKANFNNEADFVGQYKPKIGHPLANKFLTGNMSVNVFVGLGKPLMTIGSTEIFGGWFNFFLLDTVRFKMFFTGWDETGAFHSNIEIFNDLHNGLGLNIDKIMVDASSSNTKIASFNYEGDIWEERDNEFLKRNFEQKIFAILGPSVKEACYDSGSAYDGSSGSRICTDEDCDSYLQWSSVERSLAGDSVACPALAAKKWKLDVSRLEDEDDLAGFYGPFSSQGDGNPYIYIDGSSVMWRLDDKSKISGVHVFTRTTAGFDEDSIRTHGIGDGYDCSKLSANGFSQPKSGSLSSGIYTYSLNSSEQTAYTNGNLSVALCVLKPNGSGYFQTAYMYSSQYFANPLQFALYDGSGNIISGYDYEVSGWLTPYDLSSAVGGSDFVYVAIKNFSNSKVGFNLALENIDSELTGHLNLSSLGVAGIRACSVGSDDELDPIAQADHSCVVKINFSPSSFSGTYGDPYGSSFVVNGISSPYSGQDFGFYFNGIVTGP